MAGVPSAVDVVVVGGGLSGAAAAYRAAGDGLSVLLVEGAASVGGKTRSRAHGGWLIEEGPQGFVAGSPSIETLLRDAGLQDAVLEASALHRRRYIAQRGMLHPLTPPHVLLLGWRLFGVRGWARLLLEPLVPCSLPDGGEEGELSVMELCRRRVGARAAQILGSALVAGVYAGDAARLSARAAFPRLHAVIERGSLVGGLVRQRRSGGGAVRGGLHTLRDGMVSLPRRLLEVGQERYVLGVRVACEVSGLERHQAGWRVALRNGHSEERVAARSVVLAVGPGPGARLLRGVSPQLAQSLGEITCSSLAVVALGFGGGERTPVGAGCLRGVCAQTRSLGVLFESNTFTHRAPPGGMLTRSFLGGAQDPKVLELDDQELIEIARDDHRRLFGLRSTPLLAEVVRHPYAIPQYTFGHQHRVAAIGQQLERLPGLFLAGTALEGVGLEHAAGAGLRAAGAALEHVRSSG